MNKTLFLAIGLSYLLGTTSLHAQCLGGQSAGLVTPGTLMQTQILSDQQLEYLEVNVSIGTTYLFSLCAAQGGIGRGNSRLTLLDNTGAFITENIDAGGACGNDAEIIYTATFSGIVRVLASRNNCNTGNNQNGHRLAYRIVTQSATCTSNPHPAPSCATTATTHTIDMGNTTAAVFFRGDSESRLQTIYLASELTGIGLGPNDQIQGIRFEFNGNINSCFQDLTIMMGHTAKTSYLNTGDYIASLTTVASPFDYQVSTTGFGTNGTMYFDTPFTWNGIDNLVLEANISCSSTTTTDFRASPTADTRTLAIFDPSSCNTNTQQRSFSFIPNIEFTVCEPVVLSQSLDFNIFESDNKVEIMWDKAEEYHGDIYTILRSQDGIEWEEIGSVFANEDMPFYRFIDHKPPFGFSYYRLSYRDINGNPRLSHIKKVQLHALSLGELYPNPSNGRLYFRIFSTVDDMMSLQVLDMLGRPIYRKQHNISVGTSKLDLDLSIYAKGNYTLVVTFRHQDLVQYHRFILD